jgi:hypothetical protein
MKYEYVTSDKLKKSIKKKDKSTFENQIRLMTEGIYPDFKIDKAIEEGVIEFAVSDALKASISYKDDGNSTFIYFKEVITESIKRNTNYQELVEAPKKGISRWFK